jgi:peroxiredoxin
MLRLWKPGENMDLIRMLVLLPLMAFAQQQAPGPAAEPPTAKAEGPTTKPALAIAPEARTLLDDMNKAYHELAHVQMAGTLRVDIQIEGEKPEQHDVKFTSSFEAPNKFRHDVLNEVLIGSTGKDVYTFKAKDKNYTLNPAPKDRVALSEYPPQLMADLTAQDISLALVLASDPAQELMSDATSVSKAPDTQIDGAAYPTLQVGQDDQTTTFVSLDPATHLIKQTRSDLTTALKKRRPDLVSATVSTVYTDVKTAAPETPVAYAWTPPVGAIDAAQGASARPMDESEADALVGKAAPDFTLKDLDGKSVSLASLKGRVVILDFWATWCEVCKESLPRLQGYAAAHQTEGVLVYGINLEDTAADAKKFWTDNKLTLPTLLDPDGRVGKAYGINPLPTTILIDRDGKVVKVIDGYVPKFETEILNKALVPLIKK